MLTSRNSWKLKAGTRATHLREQRKRLNRAEARSQARHGELQEKIIQLEAENASLRATQPNTLPIPVHPVRKPTELRVLCVLILVNGVVSFRAVPRLLVLLHSLGWVQGLEIPHFTSVIHWVLRVGVALFSQVTISDSPWVAIIDCSIDIGTRKALVVLRVSLDALARKQGAIGLADCECIGLEISNRWNGPLVKAALARVFAKAGAPRAIIKDGGTDLKKGVELYRETEDAKRIWVIDDVGHIAANALKAEFSERSAFLSFLEILRKGAARIRQTDLAWLLPPKIRTKGRFQGITPVAQWAEKILGLMGGQGRSKEDSELNLLRKAFCGLAQLRVFLIQFAATCRIIEQFLKLTKNKGINQATYSEAKALLEKLPETSDVRVRLESWLTRHLRVQSRLGIGQLPLLVSSDVIESLFGKFKTIIQRNPQAELNRLIYTIPLLCGKHTDVEIDRALHDCSHIQMLDQVEQTIPTTLRQQRHRVLDSASRNQVPEAGNPGRLKAG